MKIKIKDRDVESAKDSDVADALIVSENNHSVKRATRFYAFPLLELQKWFIGTILLFIAIILFLNTWELTTLHSDIQEFSYNIASRLNKMESRAEFISMLKSKNEEDKEVENPIFFHIETRLIQHDSGIQKNGEEEKEIGKHSFEDYFGFENGTDSKEGDYYDDRIIFHKVLPSESEEEMMNTSTNSTNRINAANSLFGAFIDERLSSPPVSPGDGFMDKVWDFFGAVDGGYVLLDREELPVNKSWCSDEEDSILTIQLSQDISPISISYQHSKWNGTVPNGAPKSYFVMGCLDTQCENRVVLGPRCEYKSDNQSTQEQECQVKPQWRVSHIKAVQIQIRENHGNVEKTCAYLFRVYGISDSTQKELKPVSRIQDISIRDEMCSYAASEYYSLPSFFYNAMNFNCTKLYSNDCCSYCPECCTECNMSLTNESVFVFAVIIFGFFGLVLLMEFLLIRAAKFLWVSEDSH
ncbi:hypothetical protein CRE_24892 [Caenorhabditis remanei]|uniref:SUN domain-containing protein n=1 Tax=Caenorhabditis remanei TaxID=31234 RepID=E3NR38_CAERE|nr:hypothetical protein CRE_24892 [Caenorhabditis remanei]